MKHQTDPHRAHPDTVLGIIEWHLAGGCSSSIHGLVQQLREQCRVPDPPRPPAPVLLPWRTGRKALRTIYDAGGELIGMMDTPGDAQRVVDAVNSTALSGPAGAAAKESSDIAAPAVAAKVEEPLPCPGCGRPMYRVGGPGAHRGWTCVNCNAAGDPEEDHPDARPCGCEDSVALAAELVRRDKECAALRDQLATIRRLARSADVVKLFQTIDGN